MSTEGTSYPRIWVTRFIDWGRKRSIDRPLLFGCLTLGMVPVVLTCIFFALTFEQLPGRYVTAHLLAMGVPFVGPAAIWYWDARVFPRFVEQTANIAVTPEAVHQVADEYKRIFATRYLRTAIPWTVLVVGAIALNIEYFASIGVGGVTDVSFWIYLLLAVWLGLISGIGFHIAITAIRAIRAVGDLDLKIDPLHPDGLSGLSSVGYLATWTTMLISLGSLALPLAFLLGTEGGYGEVIYFAVGIYVVVIVVSFAYPTIYVNRRAQEIRERELENRQAKIRRLQAQATDIEESGGGTNETATMDEVAKRLEMQRLRDEYNEYAGVSLYPLSVGIITRLVSSILLPISFILVDTYLGRIL